MRWIGLGVVVLAAAWACTGNTIELEEGSAGGTGTAGQVDDGVQDDGGPDTGPDDGRDVSGDGGDMPLPTTVGPMPDTGDVLEEGIMPGRYLLAVDTVVQPGIPLQWEVYVDRNPDTFTGQSLTLDQGSTDSPRELIGGVWEATLKSDATSIAVEIVPLGIMGAANPITGGDILTTALVLDGQPRERIWCGRVSGAIEEPLILDLAGSVFALIPVAEGDEWPRLDLPIRC